MTDKVLSGANVAHLLCVGGPYHGKYLSKRYDKYTGHNVIVPSFGVYIVCDLPAYGQRFIFVSNYSTKQGKE